MAASGVGDAILRITSRPNIPVPPPPQVIRTSPLGLVTGRDYYMTSARAEVTPKLQFAVRGVIRSYNVFYPVAVIADFVAVRLPGRFVLE